MSISQNYPIVSPSLNLDFANTKKLDPRVTFARASEARYYDGKTVSKAEENLFIRSQEFDSSAWYKTATTATANATTAPDGTTTADSILETTLTARHTVEYTSAVQAGLYAISAFVKANGRTAASLYLGITSQMGSAHFDLTTETHTFNKTIGSVTVVGTPVITNAGDGWYRISCVLSFPTALSPAYGGIAASDRITDTGSFTFTSASYLGDVTKGLFIWGAQLEQRSSVTAYQPTTTQPITNYIPTLLTASANVARFEHNPVTGESLGLEVEEQRTNLLLRSQEFNTTWVFGAGGTGAVTVDQAVAPDGTLSADLLYDLNTTNNYRVIDQTVSLTSASSYSMSCFVKSAGNGFAYLRIGQSATGNNIIVYFNLNSGVVGTSSRVANANSPTIVSSGISPVGNSWYRVSVAFTASVTASHYCQLGMSNADNAFGYVGNGYSGIYIWGAQLEAGGFSTSYVKTVASQVTRAADSASMVGSNFSEWYRADEGSFYVESQAVSRTAQGHVSAGVSNSTAANVFYIQMFTSSNIFNYAVNGNVTQAALSADVTPLANVNYKTAFGYKTNDFASSFNGGVIKTDTSGTLPQNINMLTLGTLYIGSNQPLTGTIKKFSYYPVRISNAQLQGLTS